MNGGSAWAIALALWAGCLVPGPWWCAPAGAGAVLAAAALGRDRRRLWALVAGAALLGAGLAGGRLALADDALLLGLARSGGAADVAAVVLTEPRATEHGAWAVVGVRELDGREVRERASVQLGAVLPEVGDRIAARITARPLAEEGFDAHLRRLHAVAHLQPVGEVEVVARGGPVWRVTAALRARARQAATARLDPDRAAILTGLLTGDVRGQSAQREDQLARAGLAHLVVVSGRHVALLLAGVLGMAVLLGAGARGRRMAGLAAVAGYVVLVRWQPSVLRAGVMATLVLVAGLLGRRADPRHSLAMAVLLLLLVDPLLAGHLGFGLSVTATAGVLLLAPWLAPRLRGPRSLRVVVAASLGAQIGAAPLLLRLEHGVSLATVPANVLAVPLAAAAQAVGVAAVALAVVSPAAGGLVAWLAGPPAGGILAIAERAAAAPALDAALPASPLAVAAGVAAGALVAVVVRRGRPRLALACAVLAVMLALLPALRSPPAVTALTVTALDVGQGDAILVEVPGTDGPPSRLLVDGGPEEGLALRRLRERGVRSLDAVVATHPHDDHTAGLPAVLGALPVGAVLTGPAARHPTVDGASAAAVEGLAAARGIPVRRVAAGQRFSLGAAVVEVLSPPASGWLELPANERSVVLRVVADTGSALLTGDAEVAAQNRLLADPARLRAAVLKVPHHGGATNAAGFLRAVGATDVVISVGAGNGYGHPHPAVLRELAGVRVHRTDQEGTVSLAITAEGVQRRPRRRAPPARWRHPPRRALGADLSHCGVAATGRASGRRRRCPA